MEDDFIKKLNEKYERGEISEDTYKDILDRYMQEYREKSDRSEKSENDESKKEIYKCAGSCVLQPGNYEQIHVSGSVRIEGDIYAERIFVGGAINSQGNIEAEQFKSAGAVKINGDLKAERINIAGSFKGMNVEGDSIKMAGAINAKGIIGDRVFLGGYIIADFVKGDELEIKIGKNSSIDNIFGDRIEIKSERGFFRKFKGKLKCSKIEGDEIYVECVIADMIEGDRVIIGDNCDIGIVKGSEVRVSKKSKVKKVIENE